MQVPKTTSHSIYFFKSLEKKILHLSKEVRNVASAIFFLLKSSFGFSPYKIKTIDAKKISQEMEEKLKKFEKQFVYPFGENEQFRIAHGENGSYGDFFAGLGKAKLYVAIDKKTKEIAAVGCGILRSLPKKNNKTIKGWYLCDLKVAKEHEKKHLPMLLFAKAIGGFFQAPRGYAICMDSADQKKPAFVNIYEKHGFIKGIQQTKLHFYTLSYEQMIEFQPFLQDALRDLNYLKNDEVLSFTSTEGKKNYLIFLQKDPEKTRNWKLFHLQHGLLKVEGSEPEVGKEHMFACVEGSALQKKILEIFQDKIYSSTSATVLHKGLETVDWNHILTNQI